MKKPAIGARLAQNAVEVMPDVLLPRDARGERKRPKHELCEPFGTISVAKACEPLTRHNSSHFPMTAIRPVSTVATLGLKSVLAKVRAAL